MKKVEIKRKQRVFNDFFKVDEVWVKYEKFDGSMTEPVRRLSFERGDAVAVLVYNPDRECVIMTSQFRYPSYHIGGGWLTEVVAGILEPDEQPEDTVRREVQEEIGYRVNEIIPVHTFYTSPGGSSERVFLYYAEVKDSDRVSEGGGVATEHEDIQVVEYSLDQCWHGLEKGAFSDAKTIIALMWLKQKMKL